MASVFVNTVWNVGCVRRLEVPQTARNWIMECWGTVQLMHKLICSFSYSPVSLHPRWYGISVIDLQNSMIKYTTEVASLELPSYIRIIRSHYQDPYEPVSISLFGSATASSWTMPKFPLSVGDHFPSSIFGGDTLCRFIEFPHQQWSIGQLGVVFLYR